jgi:glycosyltransferase involved in cell wall biosynthesis
MAQTVGSMINVSSDRAERSAVARPLRVALVHASDLGGGAERSVMSLHRGLRALGHESTVFVGEKRTDEDGVVEIPYVRGVPGVRRAARAVERNLGLQDIYNPSFRNLGQLTTGKFDLIHFNSLWGSAGFADIGALPALTRSIPGVITMRENWLITGHCACFDECTRWKTGCGSCPDLKRVPQIPRDGTAMNWRWKRSAVQKSRLHVVAISDWLAEQARQSPILAGKTVTRIYNGVDLDIFRPCAEVKRQEMRHALGIRDEEVVVLLAGQSVRGLNSFLAPIHAAEVLNSVSSQAIVRPLIIGDTAKELAERIGRESTRLPFQQTPAEMAACYCLADITLVTSEAEAFGRIAAESQACGTPVVAFDTGAIPEVVKNELGGIVVERGNIDVAARALSRLADDQVLRKRLGRAGQVYAADNFDAKDIARSYGALYESVLLEFGRSQ